MNDNSARTYPSHLEICGRLRIPNPTGPQCQDRAFKKVSTSISLQPFFLPYHRLVATIPGLVCFGIRVSLVERGQFDIKEPFMRRHSVNFRSTSRRTNPSRPPPSQEGRSVELTLFPSWERGLQHSDRGQKDTPAIPNRVADPVGTWAMGQTSGIPCTIPHI